MVANGNQVIAWKSIWLCDENFKPLLASDNSLNLEIYYTDNVKIQVKFEGSCLSVEK